MSQPVDRYGVVGHPVSHSLSPFIHGLFARQTAQSMEYRLYDVPPADFRRRVLEFFTGGGKGLNVTVPHKRAAAEICNQLTPRAERAGAVNTLALIAGERLLGDNTDGVGLVRDLKENLRLKLQGQRLLILGAGGATRGVLAPLLAESPGELVIANRTAERAHKLAQEFGDLGMVRSFGFDLLPDVPYDVVINATSASLGGEVPAVSAGIVTPASACYDMAYGRSDTPFVAWARAQGCRVAVDGLGMLVEQAAESFQLWRNVRPETRGVLEAVRNRATAW